MKKSLLIATLTALFAGAAHAEPPEDFRPRFEASPETRKKYDAIREAARLPVRRGDPIETAREERIAEGELVSVDDGLITIRQRLDEDRIAALKARGVVTVSAKEQIQSGVIFEDHFYLTYIALPDADLLPLAGREGVKVRLVLVMTEAMRYRVRDVSVASSR